jgi:dephospho-CoA kinase
MKTIALTGGIGMGKSTVAELLCTHGLPVVDTDDQARLVVQPGSVALQEIVAAFGPSVLGADGSLDRPELAQLVFANPAARKQLEAITHPRIRVAWQREIQQWRDQGARVGLVVIPLLFEAGLENEFDETICVACSPATQQVRLRPRGWSPEQTRQRLAAQFPIEFKVARAHRVIWTEGSLAVTAAQLDRLFAH